MDKMREEFEAWVSSKNLETSFGNYAADEYDATWTQVYWEGWQASRKALVVELPSMERCEKRSKGIIEEVTCYRDHLIKNALNSAGVSYK